MATKGPAVLHRWQGVLLGHAAGNIAGRTARPDGEALPLPSREEREAPFDDDVALALAIAECLKSGVALEAQELADRFRDWYQAGGRGSGWLTANVLRELESGTPVEHAAMVVWHRYGRSAAGNGALSRSIAIPLRWPTDRGSRWHSMRVAAEVTHFDPRCVWSCIALGDVMAHFLGEEPATEPLDPERIAAGLADAGAPEEVVSAFRQGDSLGSIGLGERSTKGYTIKTLKVALWAAREDTDFVSAIERVLAQGGDTDTNAAVAGAVLGARVGVDGIPRAWIPGRVGEMVYLAERLLKLARWNG